MAEFVKKEFLRQHKEMLHMHLTEDKLIFEAFKFYLIKTPFEHVIDSIDEKKL